MAENKILITIDGPSASGKGTVAKLVAKKLGLSYLDTGAMYRALALLFKQKGTDLTSEQEIQKELKSVKINLKSENTGIFKIYLNDIDVSDEIRSEQISELSSIIATLTSVRKFLVNLQRETGTQGNIIAEGRDMGSYVFPDADNKFYLDATVEERANRRYKQLLEEGENIKLDEVIKQMTDRDYRDMNRVDSPLHPSPNAVIIDTTKLTAKEVVEKIIHTVLGNNPRK